MESSVAARKPARARRRGAVRTLVAVTILVAWSAGLSLLVRREFFAGSRQRLAEAALRISPGAVFYVVELYGRQVGFASSTIDTMPTGIDLVDYQIADLPAGGSTRRSSSRTVVKLSRGLALQSFDVRIDGRAAAMHVGGYASGDSAIVFARSARGVPADSQRVPVKGPVLLPTLVPLAVALGETPKVGRKYTLAMFDPATLSRDPVTLVIQAESLFTLVDSASLDPAKGSWVRAHTDTVRAWQVVPVGEPAVGFNGWVDAAGRVVERSQPGGITIRRMAYEIAFENWRIARDRATAAGGFPGSGHDILERTLISAGLSMTDSGPAVLAVRLSGGDVRGYDLAGGRQAFVGDTLRVRREREADLVPNWSLLQNFRTIGQRFRNELRAEPLLQVHDARIVTLAVRIAGADREPRVIAEKINRWVHDSLARQATFSAPNAIEALRTRKGDCNEHTQLAVALTRALGIPARVAMGLAYVNGQFYYHSWPEVYLRGWVAEDPTFGQFPADAAHLRFVVGDLSRQPDLLRVIGSLHLELLEEK